MYLYVFTYMDMSAGQSEVASQSSGRTSERSRKDAGLTLSRRSSRVMSNCDISSCIAGSRAVNRLRLCLLRFSTPPCIHVACTRMHLASACTHRASTRTPLLPAAYILLTPARTARSHLEARLPPCALKVFLGPVTLGDEHWAEDLGVRLVPANALKVGRPVLHPHVR
jgi:hypothetical protein